MGEYNFYREHNADYFVGKTEVRFATNQELIPLLIDKFVQKVDMIDVVLDKTARQDYLVKKNKTIPDGATEQQIRAKIGLRVVVDFVQLVMDSCKAISVDYNSLVVTKQNINLMDTKQKLSNIVENLNSSFDKTNLESILSIVTNFAVGIGLDMDRVESERKKVEEREGNFYRGKLVKIVD